MSSKSKKHNSGSSIVTENLIRLNEMFGLDKIDRIVFENNEALSFVMNSFLNYLGLKDFMHDEISLYDVGKSINPSLTDVIIKLPGHDTLYYTHVLDDRERATETEEIRKRVRSGAFGAGYTEANRYEFCDKLCKVFPFIPAWRSSYSNKPVDENLYRCFTRYSLGSVKSKRRCEYIDPVTGKYTYIYERIPNPFNDFEYSTAFGAYSKRLAISKGNSKSIVYDSAAVLNNALGEELDASITAIIALYAVSYVMQTYQVVNNSISIGNHMKTINDTNPNETVKSRGKVEVGPRVFKIDNEMVCNLEKAMHERKPVGPRQFEYTTRGHWRHYKSGKVIWVHEHLNCVGKPRKPKDYVVKK